MLCTEDVYTKLMQITDTEESEKPALVPYCEAAAAIINSRTRDGVDASDIRLLMAAVAIAYSRYLLVKNAEDGNFTTIKAGDISLSKASHDASGNIFSFVQTAMEDAKELLVDTSFIFSTV